MIRFLLRRLLTLPLVILLANFGGYGYAFYIGPIQKTQSPYALGVINIPPLFPAYVSYLQAGLSGDWGVLPNRQPVAQAILRASEASLGLLALSLAFSALLGIFLGMRAAYSNPPRVANWLTLLATMGLASPSFFVGIWFISLSVIYLIWGPGGEPLLPFQGFGWDAHLVLPTLALVVRPTVQIAQVTAGLLTGELGKQYVMVARSIGQDLARIRRRHAFRNILAPVMLVIAGSVRLLMAELIIVERLFNWPGMGRLFASSLVITSRSDNFLYPPLLAGLLTVMAAVFLLADLLASVLGRAFDPRLREV